MRRFIRDYVRNCNECLKYKPTNLKPAGLLQTPVYNQRFETLAINLFGLLPLTESGNRWICIVEDTATKWVEVFALSEATSLECAKIPVQEVFLRYRVPRRMLSDNGVQFVSEGMQ